MFQTVLCSFTPTAGWRVKQILTIRTTSISVVERNGVKYLSMPITGKVKRGQFCNPVKSVMQVLRSLGKENAQPIRLVPADFIYPHLEEFAPHDNRKQKGAAGIPTLGAKLALEFTSVKLH